MFVCLGMRTCWVIVYRPVATRVRCTRAPAHQGARAIENKITRNKDYLKNINDLANKNPEEIKK